MKTESMNKIKFEWKENTTNEKLKYIDLNYLNSYADFDLALMKEFIALYLVHTPQLLHAIKQSLVYENWGVLYMGVHKLIPSLTLMGISKNYENIVRRIQENARAQNHLQEMPALVLSLERICNGVSIELAEELREMKVVH